MTSSQKSNTSSAETKIIIDPNAQLAFEHLVEREYRKKRRQRIVRLSLGILVITLAFPLSFGFYCTNIIGTNYEAIIIRKYQNFTEKMIRAAVVSDRLYLNVFGPLLVKIKSKEDIELRKAVIELGLEITGNKESDPEKLQELRGIVGPALLKSPRGIAFAVYEHPPRKIRER